MRSRLILSMDPKDETDIKLLLNYPLMSKTVEEGSVTYKGLIEVNEEDYKVTVKQSPGNNFYINFKENIDVVGREAIKKIQNTSTDIVGLLDLLQKCISDRTTPNKLSDHSDIFKQVLYEYSEFSNFYINLKSCYLAYDLSKVNVVMLDDSRRDHKIEIKVNYNDKNNIFEIVGYDLPCEKEKFQKSSNLKVVYSNFVAVVESLQLFFNLMEDFDRNCYILDPVPQKRRYNYRRIWLGETLSVIIKVDPFNLFKMPAITFLGPERLVEAYRSTMNNNLEDWNATNYVFTEILRLIGLDKFPIKPEKDGEQDNLLVETGDCSICFSLRLNDKLPEIVCRNPLCDNCYHVECLYEWLMSVSSRRFFTEVMGNCPNCEKNISCPIPN